MSCAICLAVCPFSRPGVGDNLVMKLATRRARDEG
jgi:epoxyqueuosine reductase